MLIDIGADSYEDAIEIGVKPGQQIVPICPFTPMANEKKIMAKAWDNRYGCGLAIELLKRIKRRNITKHIILWCDCTRRSWSSRCTNCCKYDSTRHFLCA